MFAQDNKTYSKPSITIDYYTYMWSGHPDVKIIESTDTLLIFELYGNLIEFYEIANNSTTQEVLFIENNTERIIRKDLINDKVFLNDNEITLNILSKPLTLRNYMVPYDTWSDPFGFKYYQVSFGQELLYELTLVSLTTYIMSVLGVVIAVASGVANNIYQKRNHPDYRYLTGTYIEYYKQLETTNYYYYRNVWNCYADSGYSDYITQYIQVVY